MATNDDDLYGDLDDAAVANKPASSSNAMQKTPQLSAAAPISTMNGALSIMMTGEEMAQLQRQITSLKADNDVLKKNIGILYRTAKSELERKDRTIDQLQNELDSLRR